MPDDGGILNGRLPDDVLRASLQNPRVPIVEAARIGDYVGVCMCRAPILKAAVLAQNKPVLSQPVVWRARQSYRCRAGIIDFRIRAGDFVTWDAAPFAEVLKGAPRGAFEKVAGAHWFAYQCPHCGIVTRHALTAADHAALNGEKK